MRFIMTLTISLLALSMYGQTPLSPANSTLEKKWIRDEQFRQRWYIIKDSSKLEIGKVTSSFKTGKGSLTVIATVAMNQPGTAWTDSTVASSTNLQPIYHSSYNGQRDMVLHFGTTVTGYYTDKLKGTSTIINDNIAGDYFDSNLYPSIIRWLPLQEGYQQEISIYDYNPSGKTGLIKAYITDVKKGTYQTALSGSHPVWLVTVTDEIGNGVKTSSRYYIDQADRRPWKQEINANGRIMSLELMED